LPRVFTVSSTWPGADDDHVVRVLRKPAHVLSLDRDLAPHIVKTDDRVGAGPCSASGWPMTCEHAMSAAIARGQEHTSRATALARRIDFETRSRLRVGRLITKAC
jgi:hypothetical protein